MIALVGFMGAGKSTVGLLLARRLGWPFIDSDTVIEARASRAISAIFATDGEPAFRDLEHRVIADLLAGQPSVLALGGGALGRPGTRDLLRHKAFTIHLAVSFENATARIGTDPARPVARRADLREVFDTRAAQYAAQADLTIGTDGRSAEQVAEDAEEAVVRLTGPATTPPPPAVPAPQW